MALSFPTLTDILFSGLADEDFLSLDVPTPLAHPPIGRRAILEYHFTRNNNDELLAGVIILNGTITKAINVSVPANATTPFTFTINGDSLVGIMIVCDQDCQLSFVPSGPEKILTADEPWSWSTINGDSEFSGQTTGFTTDMGAKAATLRIRAIES